MKNIVIIPNPKKDIDLAVTARLINKLSSIGMTAYIDSKYDIDTDAVRYSDFPSFADLIIVVGGDGSVIGASAAAVSHGIPLLGVNLGKVGYLAEVDPDGLDILDSLSTGDYRIIEKMLLSVSPTSDTAGESVQYSVNDIVISHSTNMGLCSFRLEDSSGNTLGYRADAIIFATPQGSTAYSFSAGGPVLAHDVESILVTPVCPHSFFNRSVLFNAAERLTVTNTDTAPLLVSIDGRAYSSILPGECCVVERADRTLEVLTFSQNSMFTELFNKMNILEDIK